MGGGLRAVRRARRRRGRAWSSVGRCRTMPRPSAPSTRPAARVDPTRLDRAGGDPGRARRRDDRPADDRRRGRARSCGSCRWRSTWPRSSWPSPARARSAFASPTSCCPRSRSASRSASSAERRCRCGSSSRSTSGRSPAPGSSATAGCRSPGPTPERLTEYDLAIAAGGALGGLAGRDRRAAPPAGPDRGPARARRRAGACAGERAGRDHREVEPVGRRASPVRRAARAGGRDPVPAALPGRTRRPRGRRPRARLGGRSGCRARRAPSWGSCSVSLAGRSSSPGRSPRSSACRSR